MKLLLIFAALLALAFGTSLPKPKDVPNTLNRMLGTNAGSQLPPVPQISRRYW